MPPRNNILVFIAALVVTAQTLPPNIGRGSFVYDPNSIPQNEKILRLFLRIASYTANRLIHLKNEAKLQRASTPDGESIVPQVRIELPIDRTRQKINDKKYKGYYGQSRDPYGQDSSMEQFRTKKQEPTEIAQNDIFETKRPYIQDSSSGRSNPEISGPYETAQDDQFQASGPYITGPLDEVLSRSYGINETRNDPGRRVDGQDSVERKISNDNVSLKDSAMLPQEVDKSFNANVSSMESQEELEKSSQDHEGKDSNDKPVEIESRMLFNIEKNNYVTHYNDNSRNVNNADTRVNNVASFNQQATGIPQSRPVIVNQNADSSGFYGHKEESNINQANTEINDVGSSGSAFVTQNAGSVLSSENSGTLTKKVTSVTSSVQSKSSESIQQTKSASSYLQSGSSGVNSASQNMASGFRNVKGSGMANQATNAATSSLHGGSSGIKSAVQGLASGVENKTTSEEISGQTETAASKLHTVSSGMIDSTQGVESKATGAHEGSNMLHQGLTKASHFRSGVTEQLSAVQQEESKVLIENMANENKTNEMMTAFAGSQHDERPGNHKLLNQNKLDQIHSKVNEGTSALLDQGSSLAHLSQTVSSITNIESEMTDKVMQAARSTGSEVLRGTEKHVTSVAHDSTGKVGKLLGGLTDAGSKIGSVVLENESGSRTAYESSYQHKSASSAMMKSGSESISQVGSSLIGSAPLFRSFPEIYDESSALTNSLSNTTYSKNNETKVINGPTSSNPKMPDQLEDNKGNLTRENKTSTDYQNLQSRNTSTDNRTSPFYDEYAVKDETSELNFEDYANQFADALRPVESISVKDHQDKRQSGSNSSQINSHV